MNFHVSAEGEFFIYFPTITATALHFFTEAKNVSATKSVRFCRPTELEAGP